MDIDQCINSLTDVIYSVSFDNFGETRPVFNSNVNSNRHRKVPWFNAECVQAKREFFKLRKQYKQNKTDANLRSFLSGRNEYANINQKCKYRYHLNESEFHVLVKPIRINFVSTLEEIRVHWVHLVAMVQI